MNRSKRRLERTKTNLTHKTPEVHRRVDKENFLNEILSLKESNQKLVVETNTLREQMLSMMVTLESCKKPKESSVISINDSTIKNDSSINTRFEELLAPPSVASVSTQTVQAEKLSALKDIKNLRNSISAISKNMRDASKTLSMRHGRNQLPYHKPVLREQRLYDPKLFHLVEDSK